MPSRPAVIFMILVAFGDDGVRLATPANRPTSLRSTLSFVSTLPCSVNCTLTMVDAKVGWLSTRTSLWRTTDGGATWSRREVPVTGIADSFTAHFVDANRAWLLTTLQMMLYSTTDAGKSWSSWRMPRFDGEIAGAWLSRTFDDAWLVGGEYRQSDSPDGPNFAIKRYDSGGWGVLEPVAFSSGDNDRDWRRHRLPPCSWKATGVHFVDAQNGFVIGDRCLYYTETAGATWQRGVIQTSRGSGIAYPTEHRNPQPFFLDSQNGWLSLDPPSLFRTKDSGKNWFPLIERGAPHFTSIAFRTPLHGFAIVEYSELHESFDGGSSWSRINTPSRPRSIHFLDNKHGWVVCDSGLFRLSVG